MARTPDSKAGDAIYRVTVHSYGKRYFVEGRWASAEAARKGAKLHFRGRTTVRGVELIRDLSGADAKISEK